MSVSAPGSRQQGRPTPQVVSLLAQAERLAAEGDVRSARTAFGHAVAADTTVASRIAFARWLFGGGAFEESRLLLENAWHDALRGGNAPDRALCCHNLATLHRRCGRMHEAARYQQLALSATFDRDGDPSPIDAETLCGSAADALASGDAARAEALLRGALRIVAGEDRGEVLLNLGVAVVHQGRWESAIPLLTRAFHCCRESGDQTGCALAAENLACTLQARGEWVRAAGCFQYAIRLYQAACNDAAADRCSQLRRESERREAVRTMDHSWN